MSLNWVMEDAKRVRKYCCNFDILCDNVTQGFCGILFDHSIELVSDHLNQSILRHPTITVRHICLIKLIWELGIILLVSR